VLIAPERAARPHAEVAPLLADDSGDCPLCEGREAQTPPEIVALRDHAMPANGPGWRVRVVPNRFPAVRRETASGSHELIIDCPRHVTSLTQLSHDQVTQMLGVVGNRLRALRDSGQFAYAQYFKNHGAAAGASLTHAHGQIIALPDVPPVIAAEVASCVIHCAFCELIEHELADGQRVVRATDEFVALSAFAGRFPYETWLLPRRHGRHFEDVTDMGKVAAELRWLLGRLEQAANAPAYNLILHTSPWTDADFHWHFELLPRLTGVAGFEWGAGIFINPLPPEEAATRLNEPEA
jgi:UDPglucose--hexose-1-phosphate uridylyltransferase